MHARVNLKKESRRQPLPAQIVGRIQQLIESGELAPGDQLLPERQLADKLEISRSSVREALAILVGKGIVEISPRGGAYIRRRSLSDAIEPLSQVFLAERQNVLHVFETRQIVETGAARLAAERCGRADVERLRRLGRQVEEDVRLGLSSDESDTLFHVGIVETANNPLLSQVIAALITAMMDVYGPARRRILANPSQASTFLHEHQLILEAIGAGDGALAADFLSRHIEHARAAVQASDLQ